MKAAGGLVLVAWGTAVAAIALFGVLVFGLDALPAGLLAGAGAGCVLWGLIGGAVAGRRARVSRAGDGSESLATVGIAAALTLLLTGFVGAGDVFAAVGGAMLVVSIAALRQERRG